MSTAAGAGLVADAAGVAFSWPLCPYAEIASRYAGLHLILTFHLVNMEDNRSDLDWIEQLLVR
jgi:hypothetical protein